MKRCILILLAIVPLMTFAQKQDPFQRGKNSLTLQGDIGTTIFIGSDLSIFEHKVQKIYCSRSSADVSIRYAVYNDSSQYNNIGVGYGVTVGKNIVPISNDENVSLLSIGFAVNAMFNWSNHFGLAWGAEVDWAKYTNDFTYLDNDYTYKKNGTKIGCSFTAYFSPYSILRVGFGTKVGVYTFKDNDVIEGTDLRLPKTAHMGYVMPFITLECNF